MEKMVSWLTDWISFRLIKYYFSLFLVIGSLSNCFQKYYSTNSRNTANSATLKELQLEGKIFIVHSADVDFFLKNPIVDGNCLSGNADSLEKKDKNYLNPESDSANRIRGSQRELVLKQVHLYANSISTNHGKVSLDIDKIYRMDV